MAATATFQKIEEIDAIGAFPRERVIITTNGAGTTVRIGGAGSGQALSCNKVTRIREVLISLPYVIDPAAAAFVDISGLTLNAVIEIEIIGEKVLT